VGERRVRRALPCHGFGIGSEASRGNGRAVDYRQDTVDCRAGPDFRPGKGLHQRFRQGQTRSLDQDVLRRRIAVEEARQGREEILRHGAAQAAIGKLNYIVVAASSIAATEQQLAVDTEFAEFVDDNGKPPSIGSCQEMPNEAGLPGPEKAGYYRRRHTAHWVSPPSKPAANRPRQRRPGRPTPRLAD
jgi:hypothetical protein